MEQIVSVLLDDYDNAVGTRQCSVDEAISITDQLIDALQERLDALREDKASNADPAD